MFAKSLTVAAALGLGVVGCDSPGALENIDSLTCALIPGYVADCASQGVHDKAVSILENGLIAGEVKCIGTVTRYKVQCAGFSVPSSAGIESSDPPESAVLKYKAQKFQDGTCFVNWSASGYGADIGFIARSNADSDSCGVNITSDVKATAGEGKLTVRSSQVSYHLHNTPPLGVSCDPYVTPDTVFDMATQCTGFNFEVFGAE